MTSWLVSGGDMGEFIRRRDWSRTALGPLDTWPHALRIAVNMLLASSLPSLVIWGPRRVTLYNDACRRLSGDKHPRMLGQDFREVSAQAWPSLRPLFESALAGSAALSENQQLFSDRSGPRLEETFFTSSYSPLRDEHGQVVGVLSAGMETTATILNERRTRVLRDVALELTAARTLEEIFTLAARTLGGHAADVPFALFYLRDPEDGSLRLVGRTGIAADTVASPSVIPSGQGAASVWRLRDEEGTPGASRVTLREERFGVLRCGPYPEPPRAARVFPLRLPGEKRAVAWMVVGLSPRLPMTDAHADFLEHLGLTVGNAVTQMQVRLSEARMCRAADVHLERMQQLFSGATSAVAIFTGPEHVVRFVNPNFQLLVRHRDILGKPLREAFPDMTLHVPVHQLDRVYQDGESFAGMEQPVAFDRSGTGVLEQTFFNYTYQPFKHFDGRIEGVVVSLVDVTDWVRAREQAEQRAAILEAVIQSIPDGVCIADTTGVIRVNQTAHAALGDARVAALNLDGPDTSGGTGEFSNGEVLRQALAGEASEEVRHMRHAGTGELRYVRSAAVPVRLREKIVAAVSIHTDITDHQRVAAEREALLASEQAARSEAERANRLKDQFLARISHELATPLLGTRLWLDLLQSDEHKRAEAITAIRQSTQAQSNLVSDLLDTARALSGKLTVLLEACEPIEPLQAAVASLRPLAEHKGVTLELWQEETPLIQADPDRLRQVVCNLVLNAVKFTPPGGRVDVRLAQDGDGVRITVQDTGRGFPSQFSPLLFVPFRQEEEGTTRIHGGLGLGLAIARQLVELHGGRVWAESPGRDLGATFNVWLPRLEECVEPGQEASTNELHRQLVGVRLLLVEDDALTRSAVASVLEQHGAEVRAVDNAAAALELLGHTPMDAMLCDIAMPREDGYSLIRKVRALAPPANRLAAAAFTAHMREEDRARTLAAGFQMHISKSVEATQLITLVCALVRDASAA